ncbi:MAG: polyphenol oxidase family protein [Planctomycetota bacterium]
MAAGNETPLDGPAGEALLAHFALRSGGASRPPFDSLNLGFSSGDRAQDVLENRRRLARHLEVPLRRWVAAGQVHGAGMAVVLPADSGEGSTAPSRRLTGADAIFLPRPGVFALSLGADCPLVVVADPGARRAGVAHAGWRGTAEGVVEALLGAFEEAGSRPEDLLAGVSPGICGDCYEVGEEVFAALRGRPGLREARRGSRLDLRSIHHRTLRDAGIPAASITMSRKCSRSSREECFSVRRDGPRTGRNAALVGFRGDPTRG